MPCATVAPDDTKWVHEIGLFGLKNCLHTAQWMCVIFYYPKRKLNWKNTSFLQFSLNGKLDTLIVSIIIVISWQQKQ